MYLGAEKLGKGNLINKLLKLIKYQEYFDIVLVFDYTMCYINLYLQNMQLQKNKGNIIMEGHTSPGRSLGSNNDTQTNEGLYTKDKKSQRQEKK